MVAEITREYISLGLDKFIIREKRVIMPIFIFSLLEDFLSHQNGLQTKRRQQKKPPEGGSFLPVWVINEYR